MLARAAWLLPVAMTAIVYSPLTANYFQGDDFLHLWQLVNYDFGNFVLQMHGGHLYLTRNLVFALFYRLFGTDAALYFWAVLLTHLLNVYLLFAVVRWLTGSWHLASATAALWGMAPVNEGSLGWYSVYGHVLVGTCTLWVLARLAQYRAGVRDRPPAVWLWAVVVVVGATCFGIGIGVAIVMPAIAWLLLPTGRVRRIAVAAFAVGAVAVIGLYFGVQHLNEALYGPTPMDPLLPPDLGFLSSLAGYSVVALVLGVFDGPADYPGLIGLMVILLFVLLAGIAVWRAPQRTWRPLLACALLVFGAYGMVTVGRGRFVDAWGLAWMVRTTRYHYVGPMAAAIALGVVLDGLGKGWRLPERAKTAALVIWAAAAVAAELVFGQPIDHSEDARTETEQTLAAIRTAIRTTPDGGDVYIANQGFHSSGSLGGQNMAVFPGWAAVFAIFHPADVVDGHRVYFVTDDRAALEAAQNGHRAANLLRAPLEVSHTTKSPDAPAATRTR